MTYPTLANLKTLLGIAGSTDDTLLGWCNDGAKDAFEQETGRVFVTTARTNYFKPVWPWVDRKTKRTLSLHNDDLRSVTTLTNGDGVVVAASEYYLLPERAPFHRVVLHPGSGKIWYDSTGSGMISIDGNWCYTTACPAEVFMAILELGAHFYRNAKGGTTSQVIAANKAGFLMAPSEWPESVLWAMKKFQRGSL